MIDDETPHPHTLTIPPNSMFFLGTQDEFGDYTPVCLKLDNFNDCSYVSRVALNLCRK